ncbi:MAG: FAD-dependent oxidoreductase, partial [Lachnospiraceae bacterium]|nr:FAD-dependent oxidoreductase [Lachnospiraceae bacterium]
GVSAAEYAKKHSLTDAECMPVVAERAAHYSAILDREADTATPDWKEINIAIQQVMSDYCGPDVRSEHLLTTGLQHLRRIRKKAETVHCTGGHEFMRCLEAEDLGLLGELAFISALERKETRGKHNRVDYPFTNPLLNGKFVTIEKLDGGPVTGWRDKHK